MPSSDKWRPATRMPPNKSMVAKADNAARSPCWWVVVCMAIASTMRPAKTGMNRSAMVATIMEQATPVTSHASRRQWRRRKVSTSRITLL